MRPNHDSHASPRGSSALTCGVLILLAASSAVQAQVGTPPQFLCGKSYVFSKAVPNGNVVADQPGTVTVETYHFFSLVDLNTQCPPPPYSVTMSAMLNCTPGPSSGPTVFGPFAIDEGVKTVIPIEVPVPAGPVRQCDLVVTATVTMSDGSQLAQTADQLISVVEPAPENPAAPRGITAPRLFVEITGTSMSAPHASGVASFLYRIHNNDPTHAFTGTLTTDSRQVAGVPTVVAGPNSPQVGAFSWLDPGGANNPSVEYVMDPPTDECPPIREVFFTRNSTSEDVLIPPGDSTDVEALFRWYSLTPDGAAAESTTSLTGTFADSTTGAASAGATIICDHAAPALFECPGGSGRAAVGVASTGPNGPAAGLQCDGTVEGNQSFQVNFGLDTRPGEMQLLVNGSPISSGQNFSGVTQVYRALVRLLAEFSFIQPRAAPTATLTMITPIDITVKPLGGGDYTVALTGIERVEGLPNGYTDTAPYLSGNATVVNVDEGETYVVDFNQQLSAVGVTQNTFTPVPMTLLSLNVQIVNPQRYVVTSSWTATTPPPVQMLGFDVWNDYRASARRPTGACCPEFGECQDGVEQGYCEIFGGFYAGDDTLCQHTICPEQTGACCFSDGSCIAQMAQSDCVVGGNQWHHNLTCEQVKCPGPQCDNTPGDMNGDGEVNGLDVSDFADALINGPASVENGICADMNLNGVVDDTDMSTFVAALLGEGELYSAPFTLAASITTDLGDQPATVEGQLRFTAMPPNAAGHRKIIPEEIIIGTSSVATLDGQTGGMSFLLREGTGTGTWDLRKQTFELTADCDAGYALLDEQFNDRDPHNANPEDDVDPTQREFFRAFLAAAAVIGEGIPSVELDGELTVEVIESLIEKVERLTVPLNQLPVPPKKFTEPADCLRRLRTNKRKLCLKPVFLAESDGSDPTGSSFATLRAVADTVWTKCCVELEWQEPETVNNPLLKILTDSELQAGYDLRTQLFEAVDPEGENECVEVFFVEQMKKSNGDRHAFGNGLARGSGMKQAKIIIADDAVDVCDPPTQALLAHEIGHALNLDHPPNACVMNPGGCGGLGDDTVSLGFTCRKIRSPLLKEKDPKEACCMVSDCFGSGD